MDLQTTLHFVSDVGVVIALLSIFWSLRISDNKIKKLEAKDNGLNDVMIKMLELSKTDESRQFVADMLIHYNRIRDEGFGDAVSVAENLLRGRNMLKANRATTERKDGK